MDEDYLVIQRQDGVLQGRALIWFGRENSSGDNILGYVSVCGLEGRVSSQFQMTEPMIFDNSNRSFRHSKNIVYLDDSETEKLYDKLGCDRVVSFKSLDKSSINNVAWKYILLYGDSLLINLTHLNLSYSQPNHPESELEILNNRYN
ncbi:MAG: hypothetical protein ACOCXG_00920 [Nanoarchaeota archaeon]